ncbi:MAG: hypothetical protein ACXU8N_19520 [Telluria sp.]
MTRTAADALDQPLPSRMGACYPGQRTVFRGHDVHRDLHDLDWMQLYVLGITGRRFDGPAARLLHLLWTCTSYPDARLWNNRVAALAGSARSTATLALAAGIAASEATIFGWQPVMNVADFLQRAHARIQAGAELAGVVRDELALHRHIGGYGRPVATLQVDERIPFLQAKMAELGLAPGPHLQLAFAIEAVLLALERPLRMNYAPVLAAIPLDLGFSLRELHLFVAPCLMAGMPPCHLEALEQAEGERFLLRCDRIDYTGPPPRAWEPA